MPPIQWMAPQIRKLRKRRKTILSLQPELWPKLFLLRRPLLRVGSSLESRPAAGCTNLHKSSRDDMLVTMEYVRKRTTCPPPYPTREVKAAAGREPADVRASSSAATRVHIFRLFVASSSAGIVSANLSPRRQDCCTGRRAEARITL